MYLRSALEEGAKPEWDCGVGELDVTTVTLKKGTLAQCFCPTAPQHSLVFASRQQKCSDFAFVHCHGAVAGNSSVAQKT